MFPRLISRSTLPTPLSRPSVLPLRHFTSSPLASFPPLASSSKSFSRPGPPPLPAAEQAEFDALLKANQSVGATPAITKPSEEIEVALEHRDLRRAPRKDFEGDVNPNTGERGGPKIDPFKAGDGDWSYSGRVTDF